MSKKTLSPLFTRSIPDDPTYKARLEEEYALIDRNNFTKVFLQVRTILRLTSDIPHIIRGSAGSSLVCYLLGITEIDPIKYQIELARFMNTARQDLPDIDMDFPYNRRDEVYHRIQEAYPGLMARISNHILFRQKTATRQALREAGYPPPPKDFILTKFVRDP
jgi:error-prone DNA polymerase